MPKQILKLDQFHGGLNSNSDPRDIADNELAEATDVMVDEIGRVRTHGGYYSHVSSSEHPDVQIEPGYGLFQFSHDRLGGEDAGSDEAETGDDYLALTDAALGQVSIYSRDEGWGSKIIIDLGDSQDQAGRKVKSAFYFVDGALRISDGDFRNTGNTTQWYGYIDRYQFGDGKSGVDTDPFENGDRYNQWFTGDTTLTPLSLKSVGAADPDASEPVAVYFAPGIVTSDSGSFYYQNLTTGGTVKTSTKFIVAEVDFNTGSSNFRMSTAGGTGQLTDIDIENFIAVGDRIAIACAYNTANNGVYEVTGVDTGDPNTIEISPAPNPATQDDVIEITNLSRTTWWSNTRYLEFGMTTLYDESKQESRMDILTDIYDMEDALYETSPSDFSNPKIGARIFAASGSPLQNTFGIAHPRVTGFNIYVRRSSSTGGSGDFYKLMEIDITKGQRIPEISNDYTMWLAALQNTNDAAVHATGIVEWGQDMSDGGEHFFPSLTTYSLNAGVEDTDTIVNVDAFKTAVVTNRMAYIGNVKFDGTVYGDRLMKSHINQFDKFSGERIIEASINDGDEIIKLEEYADRLLQFKKKKMQLINISQEIEFLEDTFMYKGVSHQAAVVKTDFGVAWANNFGCYLYDGEKVINLLEKGGRQIIKDASTGDSDSWEEFASDTLTIGYLPKKRQLIVVDDVSTDGDGFLYLYDMVTQSWVKGPAASFPDEYKTNFVVDWGGDLIFGYDRGSVGYWRDESETTSNFNLTTKDIDFGNPGVRKKIYKVYVTHRSVVDAVEGVGAVSIGDAGIPVNGGRNYEVGNLLQLVGGNNDAYVKVTAIEDLPPYHGIVSSIGTPAEVSGSGYSTGTNVSTTHEAGSGCTIDIDGLIQTAANVRIKYGLDGGDIDNTFTGSFTTTNEWKTDEFKPTNSISNCYSFQLKIEDNTSSIPAGFEINDISIVYRVKGIK